MSANRVWIVERCFSNSDSWYRVDGFVFGTKAQARDAAKRDAAVFPGFYKYRIRKFEATA
jgi:hypothetical protein